MPEVTVIFGTTAVARYSEGQRDQELIEEYGRVETYTFATEDEVNAFRLGLAEMDGWMNYVIAEPGEEPK